MMNCEELKEYLIDYLEGNLSAEISEKVEKALPNCPTCEQELIELKVVLNGIEELPEEPPSLNLKNRFEAVLETEKLNQTVLKPEAKSAVKERIMWFRQPHWQVAAAIALFLSGLLLGTLLNSNDGSSSEVAELRNAVQETKKLVMLSMLQGQSSSDRIQAVNYSYDIANADETIIEALVDAMQADQNVNVRLAAVQALTRFYGEEKVNHAFVELLPTEQEPIIQIALIDALVTMKEKQAVPSIQKLLDEQQLLEIVKNKAEEGLGKLL